MQQIACECVFGCVCACVFKREGIPSLLHLVRFVGELQGCCEVFGLRERQPVPDLVTHSRSHQAAMV